MTAFLDITGLRSGYDGSTVLNGVDLKMQKGEILAVLGRNGVGKTTLISTVMGLVRPQQGKIALDGQELAGRSVDAIARMGVAIVPQGRRVFPPLTVHEHLQLAERFGRRGDWTRKKILDLMPRLGERLDHRGDSLSGGEQQMLTISRALLTNPTMLLMDEPSDGLAPAIVAQVRDVLLLLADEGITILLVEQDLGLAAAVAGNAAIIEKGQVVHHSPIRELVNDAHAVRRFFGAGGVESTGPVSTNGVFR